VISRRDQHVRPGQFLQFLHHESHRRSSGISVFQQIAGNKQKIRLTTFCQLNDPLEGPAELLPAGPKPVFSSPPSLHGLVQVKIGGMYKGKGLHHATSPPRVKMS